MNPDEGETVDIDLSALGYVKKSDDMKDVEKR